LPLDANPCSLSTWKLIIFNIRFKLASWKSKMLSITGRICLIKSVLNSLLLFYMSMFLVLKGTIESISTIIWRFLRSGSSVTFKLCNIAWFKVIQANSRGGLGLRSLYNKNMVLLLKWILDWGVGNSRGWQDYIVHKYQPTFENRFSMFAHHLFQPREGLLTC
jgi:hypothetical protein